MAIYLCARCFLIVAGNAVEIHRETIPAPRRGEGNRRLPTVLYRSGPWEFPEAGACDPASLRDAWFRGCEPQGEAGTRYLGQDFRAGSRALSSVGVGNPSVGERSRRWSHRAALYWRHRAETSCYQAALHIEAGETRHWCHRAGEQTLRLAPEP